MLIKRRNMSSISVPLTLKAAIFFPKTNCGYSLSPHISRTFAAYMIFKSQSVSMATISMELSGSNVVNESRGWLDCQLHPFCLGLLEYPEQIYPLSGLLGLGKSCVFTLFLLALAIFYYIPSPKLPSPLFLFTL